MKELFVFLVLCLAVDNKLAEVIIFHMPSLFLSYNQFSKTINDNSLFKSQYNSYLALFVEVNEYLKFLNLNFIYRLVIQLQVFID